MITSDVPIESGLLSDNDEDTQGLPFEEQELLRHGIRFANELLGAYTLTDSQRSEIYHRLRCTLMDEYRAEDVDHTNHTMQGHIQALVKSNMRVYVEEVRNRVPRISD